MSSCVASSTVDALWQHEEVVAALAELADHLMPGHHCEHKPLGRSRILRIRLATNLDLKRTLQNREFREDLYFLLAAFPIESCLGGTAGKTFPSLRISWDARASPTGAS